MKANERIWELDALRGLMILFVVLFHALFDLRSFVGWRVSLPVIDFVGQYGGALFVLLSGICATLGSRSLKRGALVFACGLAITAVTAAAAALGWMDETLIVRFGVLHLLGLCMMLWSLLCRLRTSWLLVGGVLLTAAGYAIAGVTVSVPWLFPLGLTASGFSSGDFFPLLPHLGWFLLGAVLGRRLYGNKVTRFPRFPKDAAPIRFLRFCGRQSLWIYLGHQPLLFAIVSLLL